MLSTLGRTCDLDGGVLFCSGSGFCQRKFFFTLCRCVVFWEFVMLSRQCTGRSLCDDVTYC